MREAKSLLRTKLEMHDLGNNWGKERKCRKCGEKETTEHVIKCWKGEENTDMIMARLTKGDRKELGEVTSNIERYLEERERSTNNEEAEKTNSLEF